jgi:hypothetical protein
MRSILRATKNVVEQNTTKGFSPTGVLWNPEPPIRRRSSYRLLCAGFAYTNIFDFIIYINIL